MSALTREEWLTACADFAKTYGQEWEDADELVRHGAEQERKRIVAYLQTNPDPIVRNWISAQIENGEHLKEQDT
jgi:hypothetical protein